MPTSNPIRIAQIDHVVLKARDIDIMLAFYRDVLGCKVVRHNAPLGLYHLKAGTAMIDLVDMKGELGKSSGKPPGKDRHNLDHFALRLSAYDEDALRAHLIAHGVTPGKSGKRFGAKGDGMSLYLSDPEGNGLELKGPAA